MFDIFNRKKVARLRKQIEQIEDIVREYLYEAYPSDSFEMWLSPSERLQRRTEKFKKEKEEAERKAEINKCIEEYAAKQAFR